LRTTSTAMSALAAPASYDKIIVEPKKPKRRKKKGEGGGKGEQGGEKGGEKGKKGGEKGKKGGEKGEQKITINSGTTEASASSHKCKRRFVKRETVAKKHVENKRNREGREKERREREREREKERARESRGKTIRHCKLGAGQNCLTTTRYDDGANTPRATCTFSAAGLFSGAGPPWKCVALGLDAGFWGLAVCGGCGTAAA